MKIGENEGIYCNKFIPYFLLVKQISWGLRWYKIKAIWFIYIYMGSSITRIWNKLFKNQEIRILMVGLDAAGKTTILDQFKLGKFVQTIPTIGFNVETIKYRNISFVIWDIGGGDKIHLLWKHYLENAKGLIFVVDSADHERIDIARHRFLELVKLDKSVAVLVLANKADLPNHMSINEIVNRLEIESIENKKWYVQAACAVSGDGLREGLEWLSWVLTKN
ncbi:unnamed protein product [Blepharisma stoltei]|uniref:ADP-ribosylation factor n=1 Tax=Blepharisma stoltei TaxID=1481888 RepID=A0AAU9IJE9_9CILI|nr:unnamed protein product [Blepharisma stoltei]